MFLQRRTEQDPSGGSRRHQQDANRIDSSKKRLVFFVCLLCCVVLCYITLTDGTQMKVLSHPGRPKAEGFRYGASTTSVHPAASVRALTATLSRQTTSLLYKHVFCDYLTVGLCLCIIYVCRLNCRMYERLFVCLLTKWQFNSSFKWLVTADSWLDSMRWTDVLPTRAIVLPLMSSWPNSTLWSYRMMEHDYSGACRYIWVYFSISQSALHCYVYPLTNDTHFVLWLTRQTVLICKTKLLIKRLYLRHQQDCVA